MLHMNPKDNYVISWKSVGITVAKGFHVTVCFPHAGDSENDQKEKVLKGHG